MSQKTTSSARVAIIRWVAITQLSTLIVILVGSLVFSAITRRRISEQVATDMHNSLLTGEYRNAMVIASLAAKTDFSRIYFAKKDGEVAFTVPVEEGRGRSYIFPDVIRQPIKYAPEGGEVAGYLFFEGDPFELVPQGFILWALITVVSIPLYAAAYRRIEKRHIQEISAQKNEAIAQLSQNLAHDLKNPLIAFDFAARSQSWDEFIKIRDQLNRSYATVMSIIHAIGKGDTEIAKPEDVVIDLNQSVSDIRHIFAQAHTAIHFEGPSSIRAFVDRVAVERAMTNLVRNAVEAGAKDIWVTVQTAYPRLTIQVADDGPGVPQELVQGLFKRGATSGKRGGSGIGLFNVMEITRAHGGTTSYQRNAGLSRFEMTFPNAVMDGTRPQVKAGGTNASEPTPSRNGVDYVLVKLTDISRSNQIRHSLTSQGIRVESEVSRDGTPVCVYIDLDSDVDAASLEVARIVYDETSRTPDKAASLIALVYKDSVTKG